MPGDLPIAAGTVLLLFAAALGAGAGLLAVTRTLPGMASLEATAWSFALGFGALGWLIAFAGWAGVLHRPILAIACLILATGTILLRGTHRAPPRERRDKVFWLLCVALGVVMTIDLMEGLAPPADADSLAYHFALPKQFVAHGRIEFVPRAIDGAIPLLVQMTYLVALALGGETAMTLWCALSGWMAGLLTFTLARRHLGASWSLVVALLFMSAPAVIFGAGTGQVEVRAALFAAIAAVALARGALERHLGFIAVSALAAGCFAASKYTGLLYGAACGIALLLTWPSARGLALFAGVGLLAGGPWYGWNWWHTGDPVFPVLFGVLGSSEQYWTAAQDALFRSIYYKSENPLPIDPWRLLAYPFIATLFAPGAIESGRTGLGPWGLLVLPFAVGGLWRFRRQMRASPLFTIAVVVAGFYILWFVTGSSQRVRHLVPVLPLFLILTTVAAVRWADGLAVQRPLGLAVVLTLAVQFAAQTVFGVNYARYFLAGENRASFLTRNVQNYGFIAPAQAATTSRDRILVDQRQLIYLFDRDVFYYHILDQVQVRLDLVRHDPTTVLRQLRAQKISHILVRTDDPLNAGAMDTLVAEGCAARVQDLIGQTFRSRTLADDQGQKALAALFRLKDEGCRLAP